MWWIRHNLVDKQKLLTEKHVWQRVSSSIIYSICLIFIVTKKNTKPKKNEMEKNKRNQTCHICHVNAQKAAYLVSYLGACVKCAHVQKLNFKN